MKYRVKRHEVVQPLDKPYRLIPLTQGQTAIVDLEDFEWLSQWNWYAHWCPDTRSFYAGRTIRLKKGTATIRINRVIIHCSDEEEVDHKNHDTLDNRRGNLRKCSKTQNVRNARLGIKNTSGFRGVHLHKPGKWRASIAVDGRKKHIGLFNSPIKAARAYDAVAQKMHGEFASLNFPT
jgi:hypothetical protein